MYSGITEPYNTEIVVVNHKKAFRFQNYLNVLNEDGSSRVISLYPDVYFDNEGWACSRRRGYYMKTLDCLGEYAQVGGYYFLQEEVLNLYA